MAGRRRLPFPLFLVLVLGLVAIPTGRLEARQRGEDQAVQLQARRQAYARLREERNRMAERLIKEEYARRRRLGRGPQRQAAAGTGRSGSGPTAVEPPPDGGPAASARGQAADAGLSKVFSMESVRSAAPQAYPTAVVTAPEEPETDSVGARWVAGKDSPRRISPAARPPAGEAPGGGGSPGVTLFQRGYSHYSQGDYETAIDDFATFMDRYPGDPLEDNALYWIGESALAAGDLERALKAYATVVTSFPAGDKAADAMLKQGDLLLRLGRTVEARRIWTSLQRQFSGSSAAQRATERLAAGDPGQAAGPSPAP